MVTLTSMKSVTAITVLVVAWSLMSLGVEVFNPDDIFAIKCEDMKPRNLSENDAEASESPYKLEVKTSPVIAGDLVNLTLTSIDGKTPFRAFMIQAQDEFGYRPVGTFLPPCNNRTNSFYHHSINCTKGGDPNNTVVQFNEELKLTDDVTWLSPITLKGNITFSYTVIKDEQNYWVDQRTEKIPVQRLSKEDFDVKTYIHSYRPDWYIDRFEYKNCFGPYETP